MNDQKTVKPSVGAMSQAHEHEDIGGEDVEDAGIPIELMVADTPPDGHPFPEKKKD